MIKNTIYNEYVHLNLNYIQICWLIEKWKEAAQNHSSNSKNEIVDFLNHVSSLISRVLLTQIQSQKTIWIS